VVRTGKRRRSPFAPVPSALPPTARQDEFLAAIGALTAELGRGPSTVEIAARLGITRDGCRSQLRALERKGAIGDIPKTVRSGRWALRGEER
jgi:DNA-directed RNA polymerase specialized sigma subunit